MRRALTILASGASILACSTEPTPTTVEVVRAVAPIKRDATEPPNALAQLGKRIFEDTRLSATGTQACASCHVAADDFAGNANPIDPLFPVSSGAVAGELGSRNTPSAMYMLFSPSFRFVLDEGEYIPVGGQFWDGRADGLADQAKQPFLNPHEMALPDTAAVVDRIRTSQYAGMFRGVFGQAALDDDALAFEHVAQAIAAFERTAAFAPFSSKFDRFLRGQGDLTAQEQHGFDLFVDPEKGNCIGCHVGDRSSTEPSAWLFTDFTYDNLGVPRNARIPDNADPEHFDLGVCAQAGLIDKVPAAAGDAAQLVADLCGAFKVPTLRNVAVTAPYFHNGRFTTLHEVVSFYATRDTNPERWYPVREDGGVDKFDDLPPEYRGNVNTSEVPYDRQPGQAPRLDDPEVEAVVAFLETLSDGYVPGRGNPR